jgi:glutathione S-transferase
MLTLYEHPFASYCWKALIALYEREVPFEPHLVLDEADREELSRLWPARGIPVLVDAAAGLTVPESSAVIEYLGHFGAAPPLIPVDPAVALQARLWDRILDGQVMTPMQKIVADSLRPVAVRDAYGVGEAREQLEPAYELLDRHLEDRLWAAGDTFTLADCAAAPSLFYARVVHRWDKERLVELTRYFESLTTRRSVARVIEEARQYRHLFPLPWPEDAA